MNIEYRYATKDDAYGIAYVSAYSWKETYSGLLPEEYLNERINNIELSIDKTIKFLKYHPEYLVATENNQVIGICEYERCDDEKYKDYGRIGALYVLKKYQGYGVGKTLFKMAVEGLIDMGYSKMLLECMQGNNTINFYKKYGAIIDNVVDFPIRNVGSVKAGIVVFDDLKELYQKLSKNNKIVAEVKNKMEKFYFEEPSIKRRKAAIDYINEFYNYNSDINGTGGLQRYLDNYEGWLEKLEEDYNRIPNEEKVPARTYFLVRENDDKIIGMINIRLSLNERLKKFGGHIGYSIRPTERGKGYNKINLYLGLKVCDQYGIDKVFMDADKNNPASWKNMEALGGINIREYYDDENAHCVVKDYDIDVKQALLAHGNEYEKLVIKK